MRIKSRHATIPDSLAESVLQLMQTRKDMTALAKQLKHIASLMSDDAMISVLEETADDINLATIAMNETHNEMVGYFATLDL